MQIIYDRYDRILQGEEVAIPDLGGRNKNTFAVTNFRGGIGKTTLSFNISYAMSLAHQMLFVDVCPQLNFTSLLMNNALYEGATIHDAFMRTMMGGAWDPSDDPSILSVRVQDYNQEFRSGKTCYVIPGSSRLFLFPSQFYSRLNEYYSTTTPSDSKWNPTASILQMLKITIRKELEENKAEKVLIDTSPFFAGGTHLAWAAADALIIPVRVDEQSIFSLELTLDMLEKEDSDFNIWRTRANIQEKPVVQAILMTHCGWNRQANHEIDRASKMYIERAVKIAEKHSAVFATGNPIDHFALLSDFQSSGRISGSKAIPIAKLNEGQSHTIDGRRLEVNKSVSRYQLELKYATKLIDN